MTSQARKWAEEFAEEIAKEMDAQTPEEFEPVEWSDLAPAWLDGFRKAVEVARENMDTSSFDGPSGGMDRYTWETVNRLESFLQEQEENGK